MVTLYNLSMTLPSATAIPSSFCHGSKQESPTSQPNWVYSNALTVYRFIPTVNYRVEQEKTNSNINIRINNKNAKHTPDFNMFDMILSWLSSLNKTLLQFKQVGRVRVMFWVNFGFSLKYVQKKLYEHKIIT